MDLMKNINSLSIPEKISLYNCLYEDLSGKGIDGDTELAHVNKEEMEVLRSMGGSGTINPHTDLIQFGGGSKSPPAQQTVKQEATIPPELRPFVTDILEQAKAINDRRTSEGYVPFQGPRLADFTQDQQVAFQGVRDTLGASDPYFDRASQLTESSSAAPTSESVGELMNPYIQNVLDIQRREARRDADKVGQQIAARAAQQGGFGGTRDAVLAAEHERETQRNLDDIQSRGLAAAFEDAQTRFAQQRERERASGQQFAGLGTRIPEQRLRELGAVENVGRVQQDRGQQAIDIAQQEYEFGRTFPERSLQDYSSIIRGFSSPVPASEFKTVNTTAPRASFGQKAATGIGLGLQGADLVNRFKGSKEGGLVGLSNGGRPQEQYLPRIFQDEKPTTDTLGEERQLIKKARQAQEEARILAQVAEKYNDPEYNKFLEGKVGNSVPVPARLADKVFTNKKPVDATAKEKNGKENKGKKNKDKKVSFPKFSVNPEDAYGMKAYIDALTKAQEAKAAQLETTDEERNQRLLRSLADRLLKYGGASTVDAQGNPVNELQKLQEGFGGLGEELTKEDTAIKAAKIAKAELETETQKNIFDLRLKIEALRIKANKLGVKPKELDELATFVTTNPDAARKLMNSPNVSQAVREVIKELLGVLPADTTLETGGGNREKPGSKQDSLGADISPNKEQ